MAPLRLEGAPTDHHDQPERGRLLRQQIQWHNLNWYTDLFRDPSGLPTRAIRGDISPWYSRLRRHSVESLRRIIPDLKAVLIIRNPIARSWSQAMVELSFMKDVPADQVPIGRILRHVVRRRTNRYNDYQPVIELWDDVFGAGCVHVDIFDKVKTDPNGLLRGILKHVGADRDLRVADELLKEQVASTEKAIKGVKVEMPEFMRWLLATQWLEPTRRLNAKLDGMVDSWVKEMEEIAGKRVPGSWKLRRFAYRQLLSLPERLAYEGVVRSAARTAAAAAQPGDRRAGAECTEVRRESQAARRQSSTVPVNESYVSSPPCVPRTRGTHAA